MKLPLILLTIAASLSATYADDTRPGNVKAADSPETTTPAPTTPETTTPAPTTPGPTTVSSSPTSTTPAPTRKPSSNSAVDTSGNKSTLDDLKPKQTYGSEYHMPPVRVVHARVDADKPVWDKDRFVSIHGTDRATAYRAMLDTVNTASVEGALMYVQAEGINVNSRAANERCLRKNNMTYVIFFEIMIAQTNETIAKYSENDMWNVPEYSQMQPMDHGQCRKQGEKFPPECLQFNGDDKQPNVGPSVGGGLKNNDIRAPYPETYWFSFPNTCPLSVWNDKVDPDSKCRKETRKGLCDIGQQPDGVDCTFAYDILGWVPLDDVIGITSLTDSKGKPYNFWTWCEASTKNIEFAGNDRTGEATESLEFWKDPKNPDKNAERANKVITMYQDIVSGKYVSPMISESDRKHFKQLPDPKDLAEKNPPCYKSVPSCNNGNGCERLGFSQICSHCSAASGTCKVDKSYTMPKLEKANTTLSEAETTSVPDAGYGANGRTDGTQKTTGPAASSASSSVVNVAVATAAVIVAAAFTM